MNENTITKEEYFDRICKSVIRTYQDKIKEYLSLKSTGELTNADVAIMIMNIAVSVSAGIYYSIKQFMPDQVLDYDYMRASVCNAIATELDKVKNYTKDDFMFALTPEQVNELLDSGYVNVTLSNGEIKKITKGDITISKKEADELLEKAKRMKKTQYKKSKLITFDNILNKK
jgi:hypothetical protein